MPPGAAAPPPYPGSPVPGATAPSPGRPPFGPAAPPPGPLTSPAGAARPPYPAWGPAPAVRPGRARRFWSVAGTVGAVALTFAVGMVSATFAAMRHGEDITGGQMAVYLLCLVVLSGVCAAVVWRAAQV